MGSPQTLCGYYFYLFTQTVKSLEYRVGDLNKNLTNGRSHAHMVDDQQGSERIC